MFIICQIQNPHDNPVYLFQGCDQPDSKIPGTGDDDSGNFHSMNFFFFGWLSFSRYSETPSPMSPTPSPAGSVGSVGSMGSQGSNSSDIPSATTSSKMGPGMNMSSGGTMVPSRIYHMMSTYMTNSTYCLTSIDYWEQAEALSQENQGIVIMMIMSSHC